MHDQPRFLIFTFNVDIIHSLSLYIMLVQGSHSIAMFAAHTLRDLIATYISGVSAYKLNNIIIANCNNTKLQLGGFFVTFSFLLS